MCHHQCLQWVSRHRYKLACVLWDAATSMGYAVNIAYSTFSELPDRLSAFRLLSSHPNSICCQCTCIQPAFLVLSPSNQCTRLGIQALHDHPHLPQWMPHAVLKLSWGALPAAFPSEIADFPTCSRDGSLQLLDILLHEQDYTPEKEPMVSSWDYIYGRCRKTCLEPLACVILNAVVDA